MKDLLLFRVTFIGKFGRTNKSLQRCWNHLSVSFWRQILRYSRSRGVMVAGINSMHFILHILSKVSTLKPAAPDREEK